MRKRQEDPTKCRREREREREERRGKERSTNMHINLNRIIFTFLTDRKERRTPGKNGYDKDLP